MTAPIPAFTSVCTPKPTILFAFTFVVPSAISQMPDTSVDAAAPAAPPATGPANPVTAPPTAPPIAELT